MAIYSKHADTPDRLKIEADDITVKLVRNGDGTATIKWNIPNISGCNVEDLIYDGIVITVSKKPANYITTSPQDGVYYDADPTFDQDMHTGDKINVASVVGAFYHDRSTTSLTVTDVEDRTPYYVSAYAVDQVGNYYREGTHAYSLPTGQKEDIRESEERPAFHDIQIDTPEGITPRTRTGLEQDKTYNLKITINEDCYDFTDLLGSDMQTYKDMAALINRRFKILVDPYVGPRYPNYGKYRVDVDGNIVYQWDGTQDVEQTSTFLDNDPASPVFGSYWFKPSTHTLYNRESSAWAVVTSIIEYDSDPSDPSDGTVWFDKVLDSSGTLDKVNSLAWAWEAGTWCKKPTKIQTRNPLLPPLLTSGDYWYNEGTGIVSKRNPEIKKWDEVDVIVWDTDPNNVTDGNFWYSPTTELAYVRDTGVWDDVTNIRYEERNSNGELDSPAPNAYWFIPSEQLMFQRDSGNTTWNEINVIIADTDPTDRESCDLWWNVSPSIDFLYVWDEVNSQWNAVNEFFQSSNDPAAAVALENGTIWYNPDSEVMQRITGLNCSNVNYIESTYDPVNLPVGVVWHDIKNSMWYIWDGSSFTYIDVIVNENDPYDVSDGVFWYDEASDILYLRESGAWVKQEFTTKSLAPAKNTYYLSTVNDDLELWNGKTWEEACGLAELELKFDRNVCFDDLPDVNTDLFSPFNDFEKYGRDLLRFKTCGTGCEMSIEVDNFSTILTKLDKPILRYSPATGRSVNEGGPSYKELGVGDDGTPDERRKLQDQIRVALGAPGVQIELTKQELDECIDNALLMIRKYSSYAYEHVLFFLDVFPNQQKYILTNKCVGFNKVININACHRMRTGFLGASHGTFGGYDIFGYAAMQQLYSLGTFDMLSYHMVSSYIEDLQYLFADQLVYTFYEDTRVLSFHQIFYNTERVLLDAFMEVPEQKLITNRYLALWIKKWAISEAKMTLSQIRGKYQTLPGPNGSTTLNSQELITQAENEKAELREELYDRSMQDHNSDVQSQFFIG